VIVHAGLRKRTGKTHYEIGANIDAMNFGGME